MTISELYQCYSQTRFDEFADHCPAEVEVEEAARREEFLADWEEAADRFNDDESFS